MKLLMLQYAGDYREAVQRFARGGSENYYAQKYSVNYVAKFAQYFDEVAVLCCTTETPYNEFLDNGVRAIGAGFQGKINEHTLIQLIEEYQPTHLIISTPMRKVLQWAIKKQLKVLVMLAESIVVRNWRDSFRSFRLARLLNHPQIEWIGSYGTTASKQLQAIGVSSRKIIPWDFLISETPGFYPPKTLVNTSQPPTLLYVGAISENKGVGDILRAIAYLRDQKFPVRLEIIGKDHNGEFANLANTLNITNLVDFLGPIPNDQVEPKMWEADAVLVPSRHEYTEGFPLTIHHALCSRTPIIASDHPMFREHLKHGINAVIFQAKNSTAIGEAIKELFTDPALYTALSKQSYDTWYQLRLNVKWGDLINQWITSSSKSNNQWFYQNCLLESSKSQQKQASRSLLSTTY